MRHDILIAREHLNFSTLGSKPPAVQKAILYEAANMIQLGAMPLPSFLKLHPEAKVTPQELLVLRANENAALAAENRKEIAKHPTPALSPIGFQPSERCCVGHWPGLPVRDPA